MLFFPVLFSFLHLLYFFVLMRFTTNWVFVCVCTLLFFIVLFCDFEGAELDENSPVVKTCLAALRPYIDKGAYTFSLIACSFS